MPHPRYVSASSCQPREHPRFVEERAVRIALRNIFPSCVISLNSQATSSGLAFFVLTATRSHQRVSRASLLEMQ